MFCEKCGKEMINGRCPFCGNIAGAPSANQQTAPANPDEVRSLPAFILGLIGAIFGMLGGICTTMCGGIVSSSFGNTAFIFIFGGSVAALIGACLCLKKAKLGSIVMSIGTVLVIWRAWFGGGAEFMTVIGSVLMLTGCIIGLVSAFAIKRK